MARRTEFVAFVEERLQEVGPVDIRAMFGGHGVFLGGVMFALIAEDTLYLKVDGTNRDAYAAAGLEPFTYDKGGRPVVMSYCRAPEPLDRDDFIDPWVRGAIAAAWAGQRRR
jgi:DNA transformation protein